MAPTDGHVRLLVVEDEWLIVERIEQALAGSSYIVAAKTPSLDEALQIATTSSFDAAILDGNLDGERTVGLAERLQREGVPFLFLTAYGTAPHGMLEAPVMPKPFSREALLAALDRINRSLPT